MSDQDARRLASIVWSAHRYLSGSILRESPYEVQYCLEQALNDWAKKKCIITTGLLDGPYEYHFFSLDPWAQIQLMFTAFDTQGFDFVFVLIGLPRLYRHKPLFCIPLYHELGHFVDQHWGITKLTTLLGLTQSSSLPQLPQLHWGEFFADLFAACYVGEAGSSVLSTIAPTAQASHTHPGTHDRVDLVRKFLTGAHDPRITALQNALSQLNAPPLMVRFSPPPLMDAFDDLRPVRVATSPQLHGLFDEGWKYFEASAARSNSPWTGRPIDIGDLERIVNDLVEKSIRNYSVTCLWANHATP